MRKRNLKLETAATVRDAGKVRAVVLEFSPLNPGIVTIRAKGMRTGYPVDLAGLYRWAVAGKVEADRRAKREARKRK